MRFLIELRFLIDLQIFLQSYIRRSIFRSAGMFGSSVCDFRCGRREAQQGRFRGIDRQGIPRNGSLSTGQLSWISSRKLPLSEKYSIFCLPQHVKWLTSASRVMAKSSWIARNKRKQATVAKYASLRLKLKKEKDYIGLTMLPRDASPTRVVNRCEFSGRRRAFLRRFRLSRISFREMASAGLIPGVTKSSW